MDAATEERPRVRAFGRDDILDAMDCRWWLADELSRRMSVGEKSLSAHLNHMRRDGILEGDRVWDGAGRKVSMYRRIEG